MTAMTVGASFSAASRTLCHGNKWLELIRRYFETRIPPIACRIHGAPSSLPHSRGLAFLKTTARWTAQQLAGGTALLVQPLQRIFTALGRRVEGICFEFEPWEQKNEKS